MFKPVLKDFHSATPAFGRGEDTPRKYLERCIALIEKHESDVRAFVHLNLEGARAAADRATERWQKGKPLSPVDGMPIGVKDIIETFDMPTQMGSPYFKDYRGNRDSASVSALRDAGAVIVGKTVTTEFAAMEPRGTRNPWDLTRTPGGSSSGSAAGTAIGFIPAGLGTQALGSIVRPASYCGVIGVKPSVGGINRGGSHDTHSQSCQGVLAASLEDAWNVLYAIVSRIGGDPGFPGLAGPEQRPAPKQPRAVAVLQTAGWSLASDTAKAQLAAGVAKLRASGVNILERGTSPLVEEVETAIAGAVPLTHLLNGWEWRWPLQTYRARDPNGLSQFMQGLLARAEAMTLADYRAAMAERQRVRAVFAKLAETCDAALTLPAPGAAPVGDATGDASFAAPSSVLGVPAMSLPVFKDENMPLGLQVLGFEQRDADLFATAGWIKDRLSGP